MENIFFIFLSALAAGFIGFILSKFFSSRKLTTLLTEKAVLSKELSLISEDLTLTRENLKNETSRADQYAADLSERNAQKDAAQKQVEDWKSEVQKIQADVEEKILEVQTLGKQKASLEVELKFVNEKLDTQEEGLKKIGETFENRFKVLAGQILEEKKNSFNQEQEASLKAILDPLKENISTFKREFETKYKTESDDRISLREQVIQMMRLNQTLSDQANNLTQALRGQVKQQGNWGEMILESILEYSGLQKNFQYFVQERSFNNDGIAIQPDVLVKYPDARTLVIDSKVSLLHYERFTVTEKEEDKQLQLNLLLASIKSHINKLSGKNYEEVTGAFDFVMMFVPVEAAYITVMQTDPELWQYAYKKRVFLISPTNLIAAMKLINDMWQKDAINQNAQAIADKAVKVYDKLVGFVEEFEKVGGYIDKAVSAYGVARKKLHAGKGNLISQAEQMEKLQIKVKKRLPTKMVEEALLSDGVDLQEEDEKAH